MNLLTMEHITKAYTDRVLLNDVAFSINENEKIGVIGINGMGKSTLLKVAAGIEPYDEGKISIGNQVKICYLPQTPEFEEGTTVLRAAIADNVNELNQWTIEADARSMLNKLGFYDYDEKVEHMSGGQKKRIALVNALLTPADILVLDEPTNHLDNAMSEWLEEYLIGFRGAILMVTHDRYFLDRIVTKVIELEFGTSRVYNGNYSYYASRREEIRASEMKAYLNQQAEIKHQEEVITKLKSFNREKSIKRAESREKMLSHIQVLDKPQEIRDAMRIRLEPEVESGNDVLLIEHLSKSFGSHCLFEDLSMDIKRGERVALIGNNGTGKTTILKIINKYLPKDAGRIVLGSRVKIGYYDQEHQVLSPEKTIFQEISDAYPALTNTRIRTVLAAFLFTGDDVFKQIHDLSGGERGRVSLAKLMLSSANLLILDEPTNHLDITSKEILESALCSYTGTVLYVSHDRYFINKTATRILDLTDRHLNEYKGNYDYYLEKKELVERLYQESLNGNSAGSAPAAPIPDTASESKLDWKAQKEEQARIRKRENDLKKLEDKIEKLETRCQELTDEMCLPEVAVNAARCMELAKEKEETEAALESLYEEWETYAD